VSDRSPIARSPIAQHPPVTIVSGWEVSSAVSSADLRISDVTALTKILVRGGGASTASLLGCGFGQACRDGEGNFVVGTGPGEWLVLGPPAKAAEITGRLAVRLGSGPASMLDVSHGGCLLRITGHDAHRPLGKLCAIDLSDATVGNGVCFRSSVARIVCDVVRDDQLGVRSYLVHGDRSAGQYLFDALFDAGVEFGVDVDGYRASGIGNEPAAR
jgi:heterotetrameric sarcosine oxidase gamma subunit